MKDFYSFVIYIKPNDYPDHFVARLFNMEKATNVFYIAETYEELLNFIPYGFTRIQRFEEDDPVIKEIWI